MDTQRILNLTGISPVATTIIYPYGSRVYGTHSWNSDHDFIVVSDDANVLDGNQLDSHSKDLSVHTYSFKHWYDMIAQHKIFALECIFLPEELMPVGGRFPLTIDKSLLRKEISAKASNSWVKCKKKLEVEADYYIGLKSLFHAFRMPMFGIQVAKYGKIVDYSEANTFWEDDILPLVHDNNNGSVPVWNDIKAVYQPRHNALMSEFRKHAEL